MNDVLPVRSVVVGTAGHIDHGKSALVLALTGTDPDRLKEEKARGITIDLGFAHLALGGTNLAFVDVPGHERFVKNMLAGVGGIDLVMLVVAADESVMPQTREHFDICRLLGVPAGLVALTKTDLVDRDTLELARLEVRELLAGSLLADASIIPVSSRTGEGLDQLRGALVQAATAVRPRAASGAARLPIDRAFTIKGFGTVATGTLVSGAIHVDDELVVLPGARPVKVRGIHVHDVARGEAAAGQRTAVNIGGVETSDLRRGLSLVQPGAFEETRTADAVIDVLRSAAPVKHGARVRFHQGTCEIMGRIALIEPLEDAGQQSRHALRPGFRGYVRLRLESPAVLVRGDRFILRAYSPPRTIAGGTILDPDPPRTGVRSAAVLARCQQLDFSRAAHGVDADLSAVRVFVEDAGDLGLAAAALASRIGIPSGDRQARIDALVELGRIVAIKDVLFVPEVLDRLKVQILDMVSAHHRAEPLSEGLAREEIRGRLLGRRIRSVVFDRAVDDLVLARRVVGRDRLALATHRAELPSDAERIRHDVERLFLDAGLKPPDVAAVAAATTAAAAVVEQVIALLLRRKVLVRVDTLLFHEHALRSLKETVIAMKMSKPPRTTVDVAMFKERFGVTRKFAIPLLEYLDRERVTRRVGETRLIL